jgi:hypothetical protein
MREGDTVSAVKSITAMSDDDFTQHEKAQLEAAVQTGMKANNELAEKSLRVAIRTGQIKDMQEIYSSDVLQQLDVAALGRLETVMAQEQADPSGYGTAQSTLLARFDRVYKDTPLYQLKPKYFGEILDDVEKAEKDKGRRLTTREYLDIGNNLLDMKAEEHPWMIFGVDTGITTDSQGVNSTSAWKGRPRRARPARRKKMYRAKQKRWSTRSPPTSGARSSRPCASEGALPMSPTSGKCTSTTIPMMPERWPREECDAGSC